MSETPYIPITLGETVVGRIKIEDNGSFVGGFHREWLDTIRDIAEGNLLEVNFAIRPNFPVNHIDFTAQYRHFVAELGKQQKGETNDNA